MSFLLRTTNMVASGYVILIDKPSTAGPIFMANDIQLVAFGFI